MDKGVLVMETEYSDSDFKIDWLDISTIRSHQTYLLILTDGSRLNSTLLSKEGEVNTVSLVNYSKESIPIKDIVYLKQVKNTFSSRIIASISLGFNLTKSNNLSQFSINSNISYTGYKWQFNGLYNAVRSSQDDIDPTKRTDASVGVKYFMKNDWYSASSADFLSNDEQKLKLRSTLKIGLGKYFKHTNKLYFLGGAGLAWNIETFTDNLNSSRNSLEAYAAVALNIFDMGDIDINTDLTFYPSLTQGKRYRLDYNLNFKYDLPLDFFVKLGLTYNFDSEPFENASKSDYVFQSTLGWEFN